MDLVVDLRFVGPNVCVFRTSCVVLSSEPMFKVMVHWPMPSKHVEAYVALEKLVRSGKAKGLGALDLSRSSERQQSEVTRRLPHWVEVWSLFVTSQVACGV